jgi:hypothetical protein
MDSDWYRRRKESSFLLSESGMALLIGGEGDIVPSQSGESRLYRRYTKPRYLTRRRGIRSPVCLPVTLLLASGLAILSVPHVLFVFTVD